MFYKLKRILYNMKYFYLISLSVLMVFAFLSCEKEVYTGLPTGPETINFRKLSIDSNPQGAAIYLDSMNTGYVTPDTVDWIEEGTHLVTLKHSLYGDTSFVITVMGNSSLDKMINYKDNPNFYGEINCTSVPLGANIFINNESTGLITPATFSKLPGEYNIKYTYPEHREKSYTITLYGGRKEFVNLILEDTTVWVSYKVNNSKIPSNIVSSIAVDAQNNKWMGTRDKGLVKFDDVNWTIYNTQNSSIIGDFIYCVNIANDGAVWIGTSTGLSVYNNGVWQSFSEDYLKRYIADIAFDDNGDVWLATESGLAKYSSGTWQLYTTQNSGIAGNFITCVTLDNLGRVWAGTSAFGVIMFDGTTWKNYTVENMGVAKAIGNEIQHIAADKNNTIWVAHGVNYTQGINGGLTKFDGSSWRSWIYPDVLTNFIESIYVDKNNSVWIGTTIGLSEITEQGNVTSYTSQNSQIPLGRVTGTVIDFNNRVWVATLGGGIAKFKK